MGNKKGKKKVEPLAEMIEDTEKLRQRRNRLGKKKIIYILGLATAAIFMGLAVVLWMLPVINPNYGMADIWAAIAIIVALFTCAVIPLALKNNDINNGG